MMEIKKVWLLLIKCKFLCRVICDSKAPLCWLFRRPRRLTWLVYSKTRISAQSMPREWLSCPRTSNWLGASEESALRNTHTIHGSILVDSEPLLVYTRINIMSKYLGWMLNPLYMYVYTLSQMPCGHVVDGYFLPPSSVVNNIVKQPSLPPSFTPWTFSSIHHASSLT